jgi:hypothetical protein
MNLHARCHHQCASGGEVDRILLRREDFFVVDASTRAQCRLLERVKGIEPSS